MSTRTASRVSTSTDMAPSTPSYDQHLNTRTRSTRRSGQHLSSLASPLELDRPPKRRKVTTNGLSEAQSSDVEKSINNAVSELEENASTRRRSRPLRANNNEVSTSAPRRESRRDRGPARPRFSSAAAAAAAKAHGDGFKPREERGWEEFHQDLDLDAMLPVFSSQVIDGTDNMSAILHNDSPGHTKLGDIPADATADGSLTPSALRENLPTPSPSTTPRRRPGRPPRRTSSMLKGIGVSPDAPKIVPPPGFNPKERLTLPKPSFRPLDPYTKFEAQEEFVDQSMAHVGYHEGELWARPRAFIRVTEGNIEDDLILKSKISDKDDGTGIGSVGVGRVEYDMDEQDMHWLQALNQQRLEEQVPEIKPWVFEVTMTKIEKEWHALERRIPKPNPKPPQTHRPRSSSAAAVNGELAPPGEEQDTKCAICDDGDCENTNAIVFCDGCDLAVHQECYGVPFIPEGQWLCRKCQLIGRGTPTCIFCPNTDGAFKQTNASRWSHLLCAVWIPEVSIGNTTFMEPVMDVEKVPKPRWKLTCYICRQKMGACIQCGNKNCYIAFHVTCARRAQLFLKMKSSHGGPAALDASVLKAFCDKHVPADWRREHDTDHAIVETMDYYRRTMRGRLWADSQQAALAAVPQAAEDPYLEPAAGVDEASNPKITLKLGTKNANKPQTSKIVWKLSSGAPVVPKALFDTIENALQRFTLRKRREFTAEMCKYWTLKRESRRGAALLKRLQLQMETFTSMEIPRRNFAGMGAAGNVRLQRRIDFADTLLGDMQNIKQLTEMIVQREQEKWEDAGILRSLVDTVYFPITPLILPSIRRAQSLDNKGVFSQAFSKLSVKAEGLGYNHVLDFAKDLASAISSTLVASLRQERDKSQPEETLNSPQKKDNRPNNSVKAQAKRIVKAVQSTLEDAIRKEYQLSRSSPNSALQDLGVLMQQCVTVNLVPQGSDPDSGAGVDATMRENASRQNHQVTASSGGQDALVDPLIKEVTLKSKSPLKNSDPVALPHKSNGRKYTHDDLSRGANPDLSNGLTDSKEHQRSDSDAEQQNSLSEGGIPWYLQNFHPEGTTIHEEKWTGRDLVKAMSEDLSDMDEEEMSGLVNGERKSSPVITNGIHTTPKDSEKTTKDKPPTSSKRKKARKHHW